MPSYELVPYRVRIGVTGHRTLSDFGKIAQSVDEALDKLLWSLFPRKAAKLLNRVRAECTTPIQLNVLSALAEGADRIVARAVLARDGATLQAVLPLVVEDYLQDFATDESKREFAALLAMCRLPVKLRTPLNCPDPADQANLRRDAYKQAGEYVVDHCDVLIAVWDGEPARGRGGTAETVQYALDQGRPVIRVWDGICALLNPDCNNGLSSSALEAIDRFNRQPITEAQRTEYARSLDGDLFHKARAADVIPVETRAMVNRCLLPSYAQASIVAKRSRDAFYRAGRNIYTLSAAAVGCAALAVLFPGLAAVGFGVELLLLLVIYFTLSQARRRHAHQAWIEYRFLTERIRSGIFLAICGVEPRTIQVLPYMGHSQTVNDWTVRAFNEIWNRLPAQAGCVPSNCAALNEYIRETWVSEQIRFHEEKAQREGKRRRWLAQAGAIVLPVTLAAAALHLLLSILAPEDSTARAALFMHQGVDRALAFIALLFPAIAASLAGMEAHREHLRLEKRSSNMAPQLERLKLQMASATDAARFENLLQQFDELMLHEAQDWLMLMRFVEIKAG